MAGLYVRLYPYPSDPTFLKRVEEEACYNIRRLRNHPSLAMWCGNNEILEALKYWGYQKKYTPEIYQEMMSGYDKLFRELLPAKVKELDADRFYIHSSPYLANWGRPESWGIGDSIIGVFGTDRNLLNHWIPTCHVS